MTDAEYVFNQTSKERKRNGRGDYNKKRQGGKTIRFPSDNLSRKEKNAMNGEVKTYSFYKPLYWDEFRKMPNDIQQEYLDTIKEKFGKIPGRMLAESLGVKYSTFTSFMSVNNLTFRNDDGKRQRRGTFIGTDAGKAWVKWHEDSRGSEIVTGEGTVEVNPCGKDVAEYNGNLVEVREDAELPVKISDADKIASLIASLAGTGAKLTIEITL